jgi:hypothetical protein
MGVKNYITAIVNGRGMARSNTYSVYFTLTDPLRNLLTGTGRANGLEAPVMGSRAVSYVGERILLMCDEVSLPGIQSNTGSITGRYQGQGPIYYPTSPIYSDLQLSFMCDAEMQAFKFLLDWHSGIYNTSNASRSGEKVRKLKYPKDYQCKINVEKRERNSVDAIPLSYGSSQLVKCTANFYYSSWDKYENGLRWPNR